MSTCTPLFVYLLAWLDVMFTVAVACAPRVSQPGLFLARSGDPGAFLRAMMWNGLTLCTAWAYVTGGATGVTQ